MANVKLPTDLYTNVYMPYKKGTDYIVRWLWSHSKNPDAVSADKKKDPPVKSSTRKLLQQAEAIAHSTKQPTDIKDFCNRVNEVINHRKNVTDWYNTQCLGNAGHDFFLDRLQDILLVVETKKREHTCGNKRDGKRKKKTTAQHVKVTSLQPNLYGVLAEGISGEAADRETPMTPESSKSAKDRKPTHVSTPAGDTDAETLSDLRFAIMCFLYDLSLARQFVQKLWHAYKDRKVDLATAAITTNVALGTIRRAVVILDNAFEDIYPSEPDQYVSPIAIMREYYDDICQSKGHAPYDSTKGLEQFGPATERVAALLCLPAIHHLKLHRDSVAEKCDAPLVGVSKAEDEVQHMLSVFKMFRELKIRAPALDQLTLFASQSFVREPSDTNQWVPFAFQVYLDIRNCLGDDIGEGLQDLIEAGQGIDSAIKTHIQQEKTMLQNHVRLEYMLSKQPNFSLMFHEVSSLMNRWVHEDAMAVALQKMGMTNSPIPDFYFLRNHPLLCGIILHTMRQNMQELSISSTRWLISAVAHLYNAAKLAGALDASWKDLDYVIEYHSPRRIFVGAAPTSIELCWLRRRLGFGDNLANYTTKRHGAWKHGAPTNRGLICRSQLHDMIRRYIFDGNKEHEPITLHQLLQHLTHNDANAQNASDFDNELQQAVQNMPTVVQDEKISPASPSVPEENLKLSKSAQKRQKKKAREAAENNEADMEEKKEFLKTITTSHIERPEQSLIPQLSTLTALLTKDELHSNFDYLSLSRRCMALLQRLRTEVYEVGVADVTTTDAEVEQPKNLDLIDTLLKELKDRPKDLKKINRVGAIMRELIEKEGGLELEAAAEHKRFRSMPWKPALEYQLQEAEPEQPSQASDNLSARELFVFCFLNGLYPCGYYRRSLSVYDQIVYTHFVGKRLPVALRRSRHRPRPQSAEFIPLQLNPQLVRRYADILIGKEWLAKLNDDGRTNGSEAGAEVENGEVDGIPEVYEDGERWYATDTDDGEEEWLDAKELQGWEIEASVIGPSRKGHKRFAR